MVLQVRLKRRSLNSARCMCASPHSARRADCTFVISRTRERGLVVGKPRPLVACGATAGNTSIGHAGRHQCEVRWRDRAAVGGKCDVALACA